MWKQQPSDEAEPATMKMSRWHAETAAAAEKVQTWPLSEAGSTSERVKHALGSAADAAS